MVWSYYRVGEMENVIANTEKMDELAMIHDCNTFHILIKYFCKVRLYLLASATFEDMHNKGRRLEEVWGLKHFRDWKFNQLYIPK